MGRRAHGRHLRFVLAVAPLVLWAGRSLAEDVVLQGSANDAGVAVRWTLKAAASGFGHIEVRIADATGGQPYAFRPGNLKAWLQHGRGALSDAEMPCAARAVALSQQPVAGRAGIDLNTARIAALNSNGSITVLNPALASRTSQVEAVIDLPGRPINWVRVPDRLEVWVLLQQSRLVLVNLAARRIARTVDLPEGAEGRDLALDAAHRLLWVSLPSRNALARLDLATADAEMIREPGAKPLGLVPAIPEGGTDPARLAGPVPSAVVAFGEPDEVSWHDGAAARTAWHLGARPIAAQYSTLSRRLLVAGDTGDIVAFDPLDPAAAPQRLRLDHPVAVMTLFDGGRRAFALGGGRASVVDLATMRSTLDVAAPSGEVSLLLTDSFLYAFDGSGDAATLWSLAGLAGARDERTTVSLGSFAAAVASDRPFGLAMAVAAESGAGVIAGHPGSDMLSAYAEGGMQPVNVYANVRRAPIGLKLLDPSLRETAPGRYEADVQASRGGAYGLVLSGGSPSFAVCAPVQWPAMAEDESRPASHPHAALVGVVPAAGGAQRVRLHVEDRPNGAALAGMPDMTLLVFDRLTAWQARLPLSETGPGDYETLVKVPEPGRYMLHASSRASGLSETGGWLGEIPLGGSP